MTAVKLLGDNPYARLYVYEDTNPNHLCAAHAIKVEQFPDTNRVYFPDVERAFNDVTWYLRNLQLKRVDITMIDRIVWVPERTGGLTAHLSPALWLTAYGIPPGEALCQLAVPGLYMLRPLLTHMADSTEDHGDEYIGAFTRDLATIFDFMAEQGGWEDVWHLGHQITTCYHLEPEHLELLTEELLFAKEANDHATQIELLRAIQNSPEDDTDCLHIRRFLRKRKRIGPIQRKPKDSI